LLMIRCLILWIPGGPRYRPAGPPAASPDGVALGLAGALTPGAVHPASRAAVSRPAAATRDDWLRRLVPIHEPFPNAIFRASGPGAMIGSSLVPVGKYPKPGAQRRLCADPADCRRLRDWLPGHLPRSSRPGRACALCASASR